LLLKLRLRCSVANSAANPFVGKVILIDIREPILAKNHIGAQCVPNHIHGVTIWLPTINIFILKKLLLKLRLRCSVANSAVNPLVGKMTLIDIRFSIQMKNHMIANYVVNLLLGKTL
jgi:hypothetical protein